MLAVDSETEMLIISDGAVLVWYTENGDKLALFSSKNVHFLPVFSITIASMATGDPIVSDCVRAVERCAQVAEKYDMIAGEYYRDVTLNTVSFGTCGHDAALIVWWNGDITDDEISQTIGGAT